MPVKANDLIGSTYGRLTVIKDTGKRTSSRGVILLCECNCENFKEVEIDAASLVAGRTISCGCYRKEAGRQIGLANKTHGATKSVSNTGGSQLDYVIWKSMKQRCYDKNSKAYKFYGKLGISMYSVWKKDFIIFAKYIRTLENCPDEEMLTSRLFGKRIPRSIDRINNDGNYEPGNIKWSTSKEQANNRKDNVWVEINNEKITLAEAVRKYAVVNYNTVSSRLTLYKWAVEEALLTPVQSKNKKRKLIRFSKSSKDKE